MGGAIIHHISETMMKPELQLTRLLVLPTSSSWSQKRSLRIGASLVITSTQEWVGEISASGGL